MIMRHINTSESLFQQPAALHDIALFGKDGNAERETYANCVAEAALILRQSDLKIAADQFRTSARA